MVLDFDDWKSDLLSRIDRGLKHGISLGADALELYITKTRSLNVKIQSGMVDANQGGNIGVGCRCLTSKKVGFASASGISDSSVNFAIESALNVSKALLEEDNRWRSFVQVSEIGNDGIIEENVLEINSEEVVNGANLIFKEAKEFDPRISSVDGSVTVEYGTFGVGNTEGLAKASSSTAGIGVVDISAREGEKTKSGADFSIGRGVPKFEGIGKSAAVKAIKLLKSESLNQTGQMNIIFNNFAAAQLITTALRNSVNGQSIIEGRSAFTEKLDTKVGVPFLNIHDDGQMPGDPNMTAIDDEGFPRKRTQLIKNGVLKTFIFDQYYSQIFGSETSSTGNGNRAGRQSYESLPSISSNTILVDPGKNDLNGLVSKIKNGILVNDYLLGIDHSNFITGDFSIVAQSCYKIEHGEITIPINPVTVAGNLYDVFNQIIALGNETTLTFAGKTPSIAFEGFTVSG